MTRKRPLRPAPARYSVISLSLRAACENQRTSSCAALTVRLLVSRCHCEKIAEPSTSGSSMWSLASSKPR